MDDEYVDDGFMFFHELTNVKSTPSSSSQSHINMNFKFDVKISDLALRDPNPDPNRDPDAIPTLRLLRQTHETFNDSAVVALDINLGVVKIISAKVFVALTRDTYSAIKSMLARLPFSILNDDDVKLVNNEIMKVFYDRWINYHDRVPVDFDLDLYVKIHNRYIDLFYGDDDFSWMIPAANSSVESLLKKYEGEGEGKGEEINYGDVDCCICLEELVSCENLLWMPCEHLFHGDCIKEWLSRSHYCPICRFEMPVAAAGPPAADDGSG